MSKELDFLLHQARFVGGLDPHTMPPSGVASHLRTLASAVMAYDEFNPAAPSASDGAGSYSKDLPVPQSREDLDRVKFHAEWPCAFHVGPTPGCEMCRNEGGSGQRLELDKDDLSCVKFHCCLGCGWRGRRYTHGSWLGAGPEKFCPECHQPVWEETVGITRAADGPGADAGEVPATRHNRARDPAVRSSDDVGADKAWGAFPVPRYAMLDVWMALDGDPTDFETWADQPKRTPADAWAQLVAAVGHNVKALERDTNPPAGVLLDLVSGPSAGAVEELVQAVAVAGALLGAEHKVINPHDQVGCVTCEARWKLRDLVEKHGPMQDGTTVGDWLRSDDADGDAT